MEPVVAAVAAAVVPTAVRHPQVHAQMAPSANCLGLLSGLMHAAAASMPMAHVAVATVVAVAVAVAVAATVAAAAVVQMVWTGYQTPVHWRESQLVGQKQYGGIVAAVSVQSAAAAAHYQRRQMYRSAPGGLSPCSTWCFNPLALCLHFGTAT